MDNHQVEVKPKKWFKYIMYFCGILGTVMAVFNLYQMVGSPTTMSRIQNGNILFISLLAASVILILLMPFIISYFYKLRLIFSENSIKQDALFSKEIPYEEIEKIYVSNGHVDIRGPKLLNRITFGNLYTNFDPAVEQLHKKVKNIPSVIVKGSDKYRQEYFGD